MIDNLMPSSIPEMPEGLTRSMGPEHARQFLRILERWQHSNKNSFLYEFTLLIDGVLRTVIDVPLEMQHERGEWQNFHEQHLSLLDNAVRVWVADLQAEGEYLKQHWNYATEERNQMHSFVQQMFAELSKAGDKLSATDRAREASFTRMMADRDRLQSASLQSREQQILAEDKRRKCRAKAYCVGVTVLVAAFSGLFCFSQYQAKRLFAIRADAEVSSRVKEELRRVEPPAYAMAVEIQKHGREVMLDDGLAAWEVDLYRSSGIVGIEVGSDERDQSKVFRVYMRGNPERVTLASLGESAKSGDAQSVEK